MLQGFSSVPNTFFAFIVLIQRLNAHIVEGNDPVIAYSDIHPVGGAWLLFPSLSHPAV
jgi:hypothetical protein